MARTTWNHAYQEILPERIRTQFVGRAYGEVVGFADFCLVPAHEVELTAIYVLPRAQGRGIGTRLLEAGIDRFPSVKRLSLRVEHDNSPARRF